jgi:hypothetical protein
MMAFIPPEHSLRNACDLRFQRNERRREREEEARKKDVHTRRSTVYALLN